MLQNTTCVTLRLGKTLTSKLKTAIEVSLMQLSRQCIQKELAFCWAVNVNCTLTFEQRVRQQLISYMEYVSDVKPIAAKPFIDYDGRING